MRRTALLPALVGSAIFLGVGFAVTVALPTADASNTDTADHARQYTVGELKGRDLYTDLGCVTCHTQQVRDVFADVDLAQRPTRAGDTLADRPGLLGAARFGPDLTCVGDRVPGTEPDTGADERVAAMVDYLRHPAEVHPGSLMPDYQLLADAELNRLATYLVALTCGDLK